LLCSGGLEGAVYPGRVGKHLNRLAGGDVVADFGYLPSDAVTDKGLDGAVCEFDRYEWVGYAG